MRKDLLIPDSSDELWFPRIDVGKKVDSMKRFIEKAIRRLDEEGEVDENGKHNVSLLVDEGKLSIFDRGSNPGSFKIWVSLNFDGEQILFRFCRIGDREQMVGGDVPIHLPRLPDDLDKLTLPVWDRHYDHTGTVDDWDEMARWVQEGKLLKDPLYLRRALYRTRGLELPA